MPSLNIEQFGDLLKTTLSKFQTPDYTSLITDTTDHPAAKRLIRKSTMKVQDGKDIDIRYKMSTSNTARMISPTTHDAVNARDGFVNGAVNWRKAETKYMFYEEEMTINRGESRLVDLVKSREDDAKTDWVELLESVFWGFPSASDTLQPFGLPYWVTKNATEGFNGGIPSGYTTVAGLSPTTYPRHQNYTAQHTNVTLPDMVLKARKMAELTGFKPLIEGIPTIAGKPRLGYFTNLTNKQAYEDLCDSRNMNIGPDLARYDNQVKFRGADIEYVPLLNNDTTNPLYQLDWATISVVVLANWWQKRKVLAPYPGQRNVVAVFLDTMFNFVCWDRRKNGVIATGTTYP